MDTPTTRVAGALLALGLCFAIQTQWSPSAASPESRSDEIATLMAEVRTQVEQKRDAKALGPATTLYNRHPQNQIYIQQLAEIDHRLGRFEEEAKLWEEFLQYSPVPIEGCPQIGLAYRADHRNDRAADALKRCLEIEKDNPDVIYALGNTYEAMQDRPLAMETYQRGLSIAPDNADLILGIARLNLRAGKYEEADRAAEVVLQRIPDNTDALLVRALVALRKDDRAAARRELEEGMRLSPRYVDFRIAMGQLEEREKNAAAALEHYREALQLDPGNVIAKERIEALAKDKR
jgi:tetratricopeptide (TPR) repeat protein